MGADFPSLRNMIVRQAMALAAVGILVGLGAAYGLTRFLASLLYSVKPTDPLTLAIVVLMMLSIAAVACWIPARRAIRINPVSALRQE